MNYYILFCQTQKAEKVCMKLNKNKSIHAFIPKMEKYIRSKDIVVLQVMFPGYVFIKTDLNQKDFSLLVLNNKEKDGIIKELKKEDASALTDKEREIFELLLNDEAILTMSKGYKKNGRTVVESGPLVHFQSNIVSVNKRDMFALLDIEFLKRKIKAGIWMQDQEL